MRTIDAYIEDAMRHEGAQEKANAVYLALLRTTFFVPVNKQTRTLQANDEPFSPLFAKANDKFIMCAFEALEDLQAWAGEQADEMDYVELIGRDIVKGVGAQVLLAINPHLKASKIFSSEELNYLKKVVAKLMPPNKLEEV